MPAEDYKVKDGDCVSSISFAHGFFWETLWNHGKNSDLKSNRKDPNILRVGDRLHIPELSLKEESCATEKRHEFKLKGVPAKLKLKLMRPKPEKEEKEEEGDKDGGGPGLPAGLGASVPGLPGSGSGGGHDESDLADPEYKPPKEAEEEPIANTDYVFEVDGVIVDQGKTDGDGCVQIPLVPNAREGRITVNKGKPDEKVIELDLGTMDPVDEPTGVRKRLLNLGYLCQPEGPADADDLQAALRKFQEQNSLDATGKIDDPTKAKLKDLHGC